MKNRIQWKKNLWIRKYNGPKNRHETILQLLIPSCIQSFYGEKNDSNLGRSLNNRFFFFFERRRKRKKKSLCGSCTAATSLLFFQKKKKKRFFSSKNLFPHFQLDSRKNKLYCYYSFCYINVRSLSYTFLMCPISKELEMKIDIEKEKDTTQHNNKN